MSEVVELAEAERRSRELAAILPARISISSRSARVAFLATRPPASTQEFPCPIGAQYETTDDSGKKENDK